jgi:prepilin-type N-terminal cleavage/methylation domain-containing protein
MLQRIRSGEIRNIKQAREAGFTLIELLIVIVVLGVLAGIVVFGVSTFKSDSETAACKADLKTVSVAAEAFKAKTGGKAANMAALVSGGYMKAEPAGISFGAASISEDCDADGTVEANAGESYVH